jgi:Amidase
VHHPLIIAPIATDIPRKAGTDLDEGQVAEDLRIMRMAMAANTLGLPAVALPVGIQDDLPQAVQVIGPRYREEIYASMPPRPLRTSSASSPRSIAGKQLVQVFGEKNERTDNEHVSHRTRPSRAQQARVRLDR